VAAGPTPWPGARGAGQCPDAGDRNTPGWGYSPADRRSPPPCDPARTGDDLLIADIGADSGRARPSSTPAATTQLCTVWAATPTASPSPQSPAPRRHTAATESQHPLSQPTQPPPASLPSPQPSDQTPLGGDRTGARLRDNSPPSPTTQPRRTPPDRVGPCNPVHRSPVTWRLGEAERPSGPWFCAYYSGRGSGTWVRRCVSRPWLGDVRGWDDALWDARPRLLLPATAKMLRIDTLVAQNHIRSPGRSLACWIHDTS
jgi:hypothetical protein